MHTFSTLIDEFMGKTRHLIIISRIPHLEASYLDRPWKVTNLLPPKRTQQESIPETGPLVDVWGNMTRYDRRPRRPISFPDQRGAKAGAVFFISGKLLHIVVFLH